MEVEETRWSERASMEMEALRASMEVRCATSMEAASVWYGAASMEVEYTTL